MQQKPEDGTNRRERGDEGEAAAGRRIELSVPQVAGSVLAAVTAAILASQLGVYGTIVGAGVVSVVATCGGPLLQHVFKRTGEQLREATAHTRTAGRQPLPADTAPSAADREAPGAGEFGAPRTYGTRRRGWKRPAAAAAVVFGVAMGGITVYEVAAGQELGGGAGTTVGSAFRPGGTGADEGDSERTEPAGDERDGEDRDRGTADPSPTPSAGTGDGSGTGEAEPGDGGTPAGPSVGPRPGDGADTPAPSPPAEQSPQATTPAPDPSGSGAPADGDTPAPSASTGGR